MENSEFNKNLKLIVKSSFIVLFGVGLSKLLTYAYRVIIARHFGPEIYGLYSLGIMVLGFFIAFASFGLPDGILRYISIFRGKKERWKIKYSYDFTAKFVLISSMIFGIILYLISEFIAFNIFRNDKLTLFIKILSIGIPLTAFSNVLLSVLRSYEKIREYSFITNFIRNFAKVVILIILIILGFESISVPLSHTLGLLLMLIFVFITCRKKTPDIFDKNLKEGKEIKIAKEILSYSWPVVFVGIMQVALTWFDSFFIGYYKTAVEVGLYASAVPIAALLHFVPELVMQLFFPLITKIYSEKKYHLVRELSKQVVKWIFVINLPLFILIFIFPDIIINMLFGEQYAAAETSLRILVIGLFVTTIIPTISYHLLLMKGRSKLILFNTSLSIILNIILNYIFVPMEKIWFIENSLGINGAALATLFSILTTCALLIFEVRNNFNMIPARRKMFKIFLIGLVCTIILVYIKQFFVINIGVFVILSCFFILSYIFLILISGGLDSNDKVILLTIKNKLKIGKNI